MPTEEREKLLEELKTDRGRIMEKLKNPKVSGRGELVVVFTKAVKSGSLFDSIVSLGTGMASTTIVTKKQNMLSSPIVRMCKLLFWDSRTVSIDGHTCQEALLA